MGMVSECVCAGGRSVVTFYRDKHGIVSTSREEYSSSVFLKLFFFSYQPPPSIPRAFLDIFPPNFFPPYKNFNSRHTAYLFMYYMYSCTLSIKKFTSFPSGLIFSPWREIFPLLRMNVCVGIETVKVSIICCIRGNCNEINKLRS